jgi:hypothetical protein
MQLDRGATTSRPASPHVTVSPCQLAHSTCVPMPSCPLNLRPLTTPPPITEKGRMSQKTPLIDYIILLPFIIIVLLTLASISIFCDLTYPIYKFVKGIKD